VAGGRADALGLGRVDVLNLTPHDGSIAMHAGAAPTAML
jgi:hypothetical protein